MMLLAAPYVMASPYGRGTYGTCDYNDGCSISVSTSGEVELEINPTWEGVHNIYKDDVEVTTNSSLGYSLTLNAPSSSDNTLAGDADSITACSGTFSTPDYLGMNQWGFRIDGVGGFGAGPTVEVQNEAVSPLKFAGVPTQTSPVEIKETDTSAPTGDVTTVWYGIRVDDTIEAEVYTGAVVYTAVTL